MARRNTTTETATQAVEADTIQENVVTENVTEAVEAEGTEAVEAVEAEGTEAVEATEDEATEATEATEAETAEAEAATAAALEAFEVEAKAVTEQSDQETGELAPAIAEPAVKLYRLLSGAKTKNAARRIVEQAMLDAMEAEDLKSARANMQLLALLKGSARAPRVAAPRVPVDPTQAYVERVASIAITQAILTEHVPEGVSEDWAQKATELANDKIDEARAFYTWSVSEAEDKGDAPIVSSVISGAVKLALGRVAKVGGAKPKAASTYTGLRRNVGQHIVEAFEGREVGEFLLVSDLQKFSSKEYGEDSPSAGAISSRLKDTAKAIPGLEFCSDASGRRGARKVA